jgi:hypothetical protein
MLYESIVNISINHKNATNNAYSSAGSEELV